MSTTGDQKQLSLEGLDPLENREFFVRKRDGRVVPFSDVFILRAVEKAFEAELSEAGKEFDDETRVAVERITQEVVQRVLSEALVGAELTVEHIQDTVEDQLMTDGYRGIARRYIVYREHRKKARAFSGDADIEGLPVEQTFVTYQDGSRRPIDPGRISQRVNNSCAGFDKRCDPGEIIADISSMLYDGVTPEEISKATIFAAKSRIEKEPDYTYVASRLLLDTVYKDVFQGRVRAEDVERVQREQFAPCVRRAIDCGRLTEDLLQYDLDRLAGELRIERDRQFTYMGLQTVYDRYLLHHEGRRLETPQYFWMRVAMGLAMNEHDREARAIEFYNVLSSGLFVSSTPTLFNAGTRHQQLSSCYLSTTKDDLEHIFKVVSDDARLSKWAGGLGNDWTNVRATGSFISGTNGTSQGVIPFLKVANDTAVAVNQGGKRKGAMCAYLETWHLDIEDFLELRKNTGDERRRTHDMNTANWVPDLFMKRVRDEGMWTLFDPSETYDLHDLYGRAFEVRYEEYEARAERGEMKLHKRVEAVQLWRKMLSMLFETGHPWITFKDPSNIRSPQDHAGVVHSSNLCTEILLNTSEHETAVCNLGSVNLPAHVGEDGLDEELLAKTVRTAIRMLDNVIDINFYPTVEARAANLRHRPVGLGLMGFQDALYKLKLSYASDEAVEFADSSMEMISYYAILASSELAAERGQYASYVGSKWSRGLLPIDTLTLLAEERGEGHVDVDTTARLDWDVVRASVAEHGMRNSNTMAIAPTATISNICGVSQSIEPIFKHLFAKSNLSGEFAVLNHYLVNDLKEIGLWDADMVDDLKYFDGSIQEIERIPDELKHRYQTAFEIDSTWLIECAARRQKWIDMGQSLNLYINVPSGRKLHEMYMRAWSTGLKTTYYLRSVSATQIEKSTMDINKRGIQPRWMKNKSASSEIQIERTGDQAAVAVAEPEPAAMPKACSILDPECEACQ